MSLYRSLYSDVLILPFNFSRSSVNEVSSAAVISDGILLRASISILNKNSGGKRLAGGILPFLFEVLDSVISPLISFTRKQL